MIYGKHGPYVPPPADYILTEPKRKRPRRSVWVVAGVIVGAVVVAMVML